MVRLKLLPYVIINLISKVQCREINKVMQVYQINEAGLMCQ